MGRIALIFIVATVSAGGPAMGAMSCGTQPEKLPAEVAQQVKSDIDGKADLILHAPATTKLRPMVTADRKELREKYPHVEKTMLDQQLLWVTCVAILNDPKLAPSQKFDTYTNFYRLMTEPIAQPAAHE